MRDSEIMDNDPRVEIVHIVKKQRDSLVKHNAEMRQILKELTEVSQLRDSTGSLCQTVYDLMFRAKKSLVDQEVDGLVNPTK